MKCHCVLVLNRRLIIWPCRVGWTRNGTVRQLIRNFVKWKTLL